MRLAPLAHKPLGRICRSVPCTRHERGRAQGSLLQNREDRCAGVIQISGGRSTKSPDGFPSPTPGSGENRLEHVLLGCRRSEEHTSELQSLMRISYAVFCLTKKKYQNRNLYTHYRLTTTTTT